MPFTMVKYICLSSWVYFCNHLSGCRQYSKNLPLLVHWQTIFTIFKKKLTVLSVFTQQAKFLLRCVTGRDHHCRNLYPTIFFPVVFPIFHACCIIYCKITPILAHYLPLDLFQSCRTLKRKVMLRWLMGCGWNKGSPTLSPLSFADTFSCPRANL